ncbi:MAG: hypothetical protein FD149_1377 [Rhodospirillaceae bacterium]|nr:MAG: hypothetical protein FD149_1377 [Rhodospirillaceae bacterium]
MSMTPYPTRHMTRRGFLVFGAMAFGGVLPLSGCLAGGGLVRVPVPEGAPGTFADDIRAGRHGHAKALAGNGGIYPDPRMAEYVTAVGRKLAAHTEIPSLP